MGHDKLRKFAENETFRCLLQPSAEEILADGYFSLHDHPVKGNWNGFFAGLAEAYGLPADAAAGTGDIVLELGCGKGEYTIDLARRCPGRNYIGVDIKGARLWKGAKYATANSLPNVAFLRTRVEFIDAFFAPGEVSEIWLTFSDPQIRKENARLSSPVFLERYRRFLKPGGIIRLKTDSRFLHEYTKAVCAANGLELLECTEDLYGGERLPDDSLYEVQTFYEKMFLGQGYPINYLSFCPDHDGALVSPRDPEQFDSAYWRSVEGPRLLFGHDSAETRRQKLASATVNEQ